MHIRRFAVVLVIVPFAAFAETVLVPEVPGFLPTVLLKRTSVAGPVASCPLGGDRIEVGPDTDASGRLNPGEVEKTVHVCRWDRAVLDSRTVGDGVADDRDRLASELAAAATHHRALRLAPGRTYLISRRIDVTGDEWELDCQGSTIKMADGAALDWTHGMLFVKGSRWTIRNCKADGNRSRRPSGLRKDGKWIQDDTNLFMVGAGSSGWAFDRVEANQGPVDGFYFVSNTQAKPSTYPRDGVLVQCSANNNGRQGASIVSGRSIIMIGFAARNTQGDPRAGSGFDVEADKGGVLGGNSDIVFYGGTFSGNSSCGISLGPFETAPTRVTVERNRFTDGGTAFYSDGTSVLFRRNLVENFTRPMPRPRIDAVVRAYAERGSVPRSITIAENVFRNIRVAGAEAWPSGIVDLGWNAAGMVAVNNVFIDTDPIIVRVQSMKDGALVTGNTGAGGVQAPAGCPPRHECFTGSATPESRPAGPRTAR